jgi:hypothetical protein
MRAQSIAGDVLPMLGSRGQRVAAVTMSAGVMLIRAGAALAASLPAALSHTEPAGPSAASAELDTATWAGVRRGGGAGVFRFSGVSRWSRDLLELVGMPPRLAYVNLITSGIQLDADRLGRLVGRARRAG